MTPLYLSYRRAQVRAFWILVTTLLMLASTALAVILDARSAWVWGVAVPLLTLFPGLIWPRWFETGIRVWNGLVRRVRHVVSAYALTVCYYTLFAALGWNESSTKGLRRPSSGSCWMPRPAGVDRPDASQTLTQFAAWSSGVVESARNRRNAWVLLLLPLIFLLIVLSDDPDDTPLGSTYTLY